MLHADCLEVMPTLPPDSVAHVITDPPYSRDLYGRFRTNKGARGQESRETENHSALASLRIGAVEDVVAKAPAEFLRISKRWVVVFHDAESGHLWRAGLGSAYVRAGVWVKPNPVPQISGDRPGQGFESICIGHRKGRKRWNGGGRAAVWSHNTCNANPNAAERVANVHPCPKPVSLMLDLVSDFTDPGDLVFDPFCGSGTTGVACLRLGRRFLGIEKDATFAALAHERLLAEAQLSDLGSRKAGQQALFAALDS